MTDLTDLSESGTILGSFADVPLHGDRVSVAPDTAAVQTAVSEAAAAHGYSPEQLDWETPEAITVKPIYTAADREAVRAQGYPLDTFPVRCPSCAGRIRRCTSISRGPFASTRVSPRPPSPTAFYRRNLAAGQKGLSVAFDLATHRGYDSTIRACRAMWAWLAWPSTPSWICVSCSTVSTWVRCRCR